MMNLEARTLVIVAHPDDEVLGCGATMARISAKGGAVKSIFISDGESSRFSLDPSNADELSRSIQARRKAAIEAAAVLGSHSPKFYEFPDNQLDTIPLLILSKAIEAEIELFKPTQVITHHVSDLNIDHQLVHEAVLVATRPQNVSPVMEVLFFELPSSTEWRPPGSGMHFAPNVFIDVAGFTEKKFLALDAYQAEMRTFPHPRSREAIEALMKWRGANSDFHSAEAFMLGRGRI